ncbi:MAG: signal peptide peptidase SppA [Magnetococcales bacterium]|nr:signal peptide peptidase SppA [Magnetococcales bacterium]
MDKTEPLFPGSIDPVGFHPEPHETAPTPWALLAQMEQNRREERAVFEQMWREHMTEQRRGRRVRAAFRLFLALYLLALLWISSSHFDKIGVEGLSSDPYHTAVVALTGPILAGETLGAEQVIENLNSAFKNRHTKGVVLRINSPGGSPVQAGMIYDEIERLRAQYPNIPLYASLEDLCASGGYYVAAAAKEIYADKATLVGSIGVIMEGFGLQELIQKLGIESRTMTAGHDKNLLDPFKPLDEKQRSHMQSLLNQIHSQFIHAVRKGRGHRLKAEETLFTGLIWTGEEAVALGLVDGLKSTEAIARDLIKAERLVDYSPSRHDWLHKISSMVSQLVSVWLGQPSASPMRVR